MKGRRIGTGHLHPHLQVRVYRRIKGVACCSFEARHHKAVKEIQVTMGLTRRAQEASAALEKRQSIAAQMSSLYFIEQESRSPIYREEGVTLSSLRRVVQRFSVAQPLPKIRQSPSTFCKEESTPLLKTEECLVAKDKKHSLLRGGEANWCRCSRFQRSKNQSKAYPPSFKFVYLE